MARLVLRNCDIYTGSEVLYDRAIVIEGSRVVDLPPDRSVEHDRNSVDLEGHSVAPGFIDIQVNGGGGVLFNDDPTPAGIATIGRAHRQYGTTGMLPTFITGPTEGMRTAVSAVREAMKSEQSGVLGIHLEGPFLESGKAGVHDKSFMRAPTADDLELVASAGECARLVTLAPERAPADFIQELVSTGVRVSAGHSAATYDQAIDGFKNGVSLTTHLFNAMSGFGSREPGLVGAALDSDDTWCSVIVDGFHVHFASVRVAWKAKRRGKMFLVTDAMPPVGAANQAFVLGPYEISVENGRCVTADGVLAGSALDMATGVRNCIQKVGIPTDEALRMASTYPAEFLGLDRELGRIAPGYRADLVVFNNQLQVSRVFVGGEEEQFDDPTRNPGA